ncbi:hypothetical protein RCO48_39430 [Peribacillus frigoritolerans]|nr:hypothetical protein [Peribacillus frigoritolerans]
MMMAIHGVTPIYYLVRMLVMDGLVGHFEWSISEKGEYTIKSKATDSFGQIQPNLPFWNKKGYGYNAIDKIKVKVE